MNFSLFSAGKMCYLLSMLRSDKFSTTLTHIFSRVEKCEEILKMAIRYGIATLHDQLSRSPYARSAANHQ